jgi:hypothetical protein
MYEGDPESLERGIAAMPADAGLIIRRLAPPARVLLCRSFRAHDYVMRFSCSVKLFCVLGLTVAKRPVLFADFNKTNEHVLPAQAAE